MVYLLASSESFIAWYIYWQVATMLLLLKPKQKKHITTCLYFIMHVMSLRGFLNEILYAKREKNWQNQHQENK